MRRWAFLWLMMLIIPFASFGKEDVQDDVPTENAGCLNDYNEERARHYFDTSPIQAVEGIWYYPEEGMKIAIEKVPDLQASLAKKYRIILISANDLSLIPGTIIGYIADNVENDKFYMWIYTIKNDSQLLLPQRCVATHDIEKSIITFTMPEIKVKLRVNFSRFLPTLLRGMNITVEGSESKLPQGFKKIYPSYDGNGTELSTVRYL